MLYSTATTTKDNWCGCSGMTLDGSKGAMLSTDTTTKDTWCDDSSMTLAAARGDLISTATATTTKDNWCERIFITLPASRGWAILFISPTTKDNRCASRCINLTAARGIMNSTATKKTPAEESKERGKKCLSPSRSRLGKKRLRSGGDNPLVLQQSAKERNENSRGRTSVQYGMRGSRWNLGCMRAPSGDYPRADY